MGKPPKQFHEGYWYHLYARSLENVRLFENDSERTWFLAKLDEVFTRRDLKLGALCLMDTHYHALVRMGPTSLDRAVNGLHTSYARHINRERDRRGTVFEKHPGTDIVLKDSYLLQLVPYVHRNPVEAGIVEDPRHYDWHTDSKYRTGSWDHGPLSCWEWPPHFRGDDRRQTYLERMGEEIDVARSKEGYIGPEEEWENLEKRDVGRSDRFRDRRDRRSMEEVARDHLEGADTTLALLREPGRGQPEVKIRQQIMVELYDEGYGQTEIGEFFNRSPGTVHHAVEKLREP